MGQPYVDETTSNKPKISRFFVKKPTNAESGDGTRGRRLSTGDSGTWFKDIEKSTSANGKFIYRTETENVSSSNILKEISNSPPKTNDDEERKQMRNPFAVKN